MLVPVRGTSTSGDAKGGDYTLGTLNQEEHRTVKHAGGKIVILTVVPGKSTTGLLGKTSKLSPRTSREAAFGSGSAFLV